MGERYSVLLNGDHLAQHLGRMSAINLARGWLDRLNAAACARAVIAIYEEGTDELRACWWTGCVGRWAVRDAVGWLDRP